MEAEFSGLRPQDLAFFSFAGYEVQREGGAFKSVAPITDSTPR